MSTDDMRAEPYPGHRCRCVMSNSDGDQDWCAAWVRVPDQPVCDRCASQGHGPGPLADPLGTHGLRFNLAP